MEHPHRHTLYRFYWVYYYGPELFVTDDYGDLVPVNLYAWPGVLLP